MHDPLVRQLLEQGRKQLLPRSREGERRTWILQCTVADRTHSYPVCPQITRSHPCTAAKVRCSPRCLREVEATKGSCSDGTASKDCGMSRKPGDATGQGSSSTHQIPRQSPPSLVEYWLVPLPQSPRSAASSFCSCSLLKSSHHWTQILCS